MSSSAAAQQISSLSGSIDKKYLSGSPESTLFQCSQQQITPFAKGYSCQALTGGSRAGQKTTTLITREGDLLAGISLRIMLPGLMDAEYVSRPAQQLIDEVSLKIGGSSSVDCVSGDLIMLWDMLSAKAEKEASERHGGNQDGKHLAGADRSKRAQECIVDIPMWFSASKNGGEYCYALNLNGMSLHKIEITVKLNSAKSIVIGDLVDPADETQGRKTAKVGEAIDMIGKPGRKPISGLASSGDLRDEDIACDLLHEFIYLGEEERSMMAEASSETVCVTHQTMSIKRSKAQDNCTQLYFNGAITELVFAARDPSKQDKADLSGRDGLEPICSAQLKLNNSNAFGAECANGKVSGSFLRLKSSESHSRTPDAKNKEFVYAYPFALEPENWGQYSGSVNMSRIDNVVLETCHDNDGAEFELIVFARSINVLRVTDGLGGMAYSQ